MHTYTNMSTHTHTHPHTHHTLTCMHMHPLPPPHTHAQTHTHARTHTHTENKKNISVKDGHHTRIDTVLVSSRLWTVATMVTVAARPAGNLMGLSEDAGGS